MHNSRIQSIRSIHSLSILNQLISLVCQSYLSVLFTNSITNFYQFYLSSLISLPNHLLPILFPILFPILSHSLPFSFHSFSLIYLLSVCEDLICHTTLDHFRPQWPGPKATIFPNDPTLPKRNCPRQ